MNHPQAKKNRRDSGSARGLFITFEGQEGAGKTTQLQMLARELSERGYRVLQAREPGGTVLGEELRRLVKHLGGQDDPCPTSELLLMAASRAQLLRDKIIPALAAGQIVLCDRFLDSTTAYQGYGRGLDLKFIQQLHSFTVKQYSPDLTFLLDLEVAVGSERSRLRGLDINGEDRFENEERHFHELVRGGFLEIARQNPERIKIIAAAQPPDAVHREIMAAVTAVLA